MIMTTEISSCTSKSLKTGLWMTRQASILGLAQTVKPPITYLAGPRSLGTTCSGTCASPVSTGQATERRLQSTCLPRAQGGTFPYRV